MKMVLITDSIRPCSANTSERSANNQRTFSEPKLLRVNIAVNWHDFLRPASHTRTSWTSV